jgi:hypothetical protein
MTSNTAEDTERKPMTEAIAAANLYRASASALRVGLTRAKVSALVQYPTTYDFPHMFALGLLSDFDFFSEEEVAELVATLERIADEIIEGRTKKTSRIPG